MVTNEIKWNIGFAFLQAESKYHLSFPTYYVSCTLRSTCTLSKDLNEKCLKATKDRAKKHLTT